MLSHQVKQNTSKDIQYHYQGSISETKSIIYGLGEVKVVRHTDLGKTDKHASDLESKESNTGNI